MANLIAVISKYVMIFLMVIYTYANFRFFTLSESGKTEEGLRPAEPLYVLHSFSGLSDLVFVKRKTKGSE